MPSKQKGITLIEVMVSLAVLTIGILGVLQAFPAAVKKEGTAKNNSTAAYLVQGRLEEILSYSYGDPILAVGTTTTSTASRYQIETSINYVDPLNGLNATSTDLGIKKIRVKASWGLGTPEQTVEAATLYSQK